ncbi:hypothetical protein L1887_48345 [Cichorium endivia]|nr:hypothetical protein L1887_48345 [Cichorium endivia]
MAARTTHPSHGLGQRHVPLGAEAPYCWSANRRRAPRVASSPDSDLEAFSHNPAHGSFAPLAFQPSAMTNCANQRFPLVLGRADIEGSKSNVAMNAWLPQASYPCDVPPQPNSPPDNVFRPDRPAEAGLGSKKRGIAPLPIHGIIGFPLSVPVLSWLFDARGRPPKEPFPVRPPAGTRRPALAAEAARAVRRQATGSGLGPPCPALRANPFPEDRLTHVQVPFTWNLSPLRPSKFSFEYLLLPPRSAPTAAPPRLTPKVLQRPPRPPTSSGPGTCPDGRGVGRALKRHPFSGLVDSAGMLTLEPFSEDQGRSAVHPARGDPANQLPCALRVYSPVDSHTCQTPWSVFQDGPNGVPTGRCREHAGISPRRRVLPTTIDATASPRAYRQLGLWPPQPIRTGPRPRVDRRTGYRRSTSDRDASPAPIRFPPDNFKHSLTLFSSPFHLSLAVLGTWARSAAEDASPDYNSDSEAVRFSSWADPGSLAVTKGILGLPHSSRRTTQYEGLFKPPLVVRPPKGISSLGQPHHKHGRPISAPMPCVPIRDAWLGATRCVTPRQACPRPDGFGAQLAFKNSMVHGILQFTPSIAFCYVLHRCVSRDIRCRESFVILRRPRPNTHTCERDEVGRILLICCFPWHIPCRGLLWCRIKIHGTPNGATTNISRRGANDRAKARTPDSPVIGTCSRGRSALQGFDNDPSAGSPTENLVTTSPSL